MPPERFGHADQVQARLTLPTNRHPHSRTPIQFHRTARSMDRLSNDGHFDKAAAAHSGSGIRCPRRRVFRQTSSRCCTSPISNNHDEFDFISLCYVLM